MSPNTHLVVTEPNRLIVLIDDRVEIREFATPERLVELAELYGSPSIVIASGDHSGELFNAVVNCGYLKVSKIY